MSLLACGCDCKKGQPLSVPHGQSVYNRLEVADEPNQLTSFPGFSKCIGSACMAWRWLDAVRGVR